MGGAEPFPGDPTWTRNWRNRHSCLGWHHRSEPRLEGEQWIQQPITPKNITSVWIYCDQGIAGTWATSSPHALSY